MDSRDDPRAVFMEISDRGTPVGVPLRSTARVVHADSHQPVVEQPHADAWEKGAWLLSPNGGLSWVLLVCFVIYNCFQLLRHLRKGMPVAEVPADMVTAGKKTRTTDESTEPPPAPAPSSSAPDPTPADPQVHTGDKDEVGGPDVQDPPTQPCSSPLATEEVPPGPSSPPLTNVEVEALRELRQSLQDVKMWVEDSSHAAADRNKEHLAATLTELKRLLDGSIYSQPRLEAAMRDAFEPLQATVVPTLTGLKSTLGPLPEHGADIRALREVILSIEDIATRALKGVEDSSWDQNGRLNAIGNQIGTVGTDVGKGLQHAHRKLDSIHAALGSKPAGSTDGGTDFTSILVAVKDLQTEMKAMNQNMEKLQTQVQYLEGRMETALSKLVVVEQSTNKLAAARPNAPPPSSPAPNMPAEEAPLPPPSQPPGQWQAPVTGPSVGPCMPAATRTASVSAPTMRLAPHVQLLQPTPQVPHNAPTMPQGSGHNQPVNEMVNLVWNGQVFPVPAAAVQHGP
ncbi:unnamed protein product [Symbiodinium sp. CCMP2592]|nr:unnamed protein product [Symbiodinium sp. CCMP2592]